VPEILCFSRVSAQGCPTPTGTGPFCAKTNAHNVYVISNFAMTVRSIDPEDHIHRICELCAMVAIAEDSEEARKIASQLRTELHAQITSLRILVAMNRICVSEDDEKKCA
jgi:hypothetical protein